MKILFIGDVVNEDAGQALAKFLPKFLKQENIDISIANGENSANGNGISPRSAELIFSSGADVITGGNHSLRRDEMAEYYSKAAETNYGSHPKKTLIPANLRSEYSKGYVIIEKHGVKIGIVNLLGTVFMNPCDNPFDAADRIITEMSEKGVKNIFVDFHAEATAEKKAMQFHISGRVTACVGTHTHIRTADAQIKKGTAYITDLGMTGVTDSILGLDEEAILPRFKAYSFTRNLYKRGAPYLNGAICEFDPKTGSATKIHGISEKM